MIGAARLRKWSIAEGAVQSRTALRRHPLREDHSVEMKLELVAVPVSDVDRAKTFYTEKIGFHADHDHQVNEGLRFVQLTPPGSACSIVIGTGITEMTPGSVEGLQMVVADIEEVHRVLGGRGIDVNDIQDMPWGSFVFFNDPDGNVWALPQIVPPSGAQQPEAGDA